MLEEGGTEHGGGGERVEVLRRDSSEHGRGTKKGLRGGGSPSEGRGKPGCDGKPKAELESAKGRDGSGGCPGRRRV